MLKASSQGLVQLFWKDAYSMTEKGGFESQLNIVKLVQNAEILVIEGKSYHRPLKSRFQLNFLAI